MDPKVEPNKYAKNANLKPTSPMHMVKSVISLGLVLLGLGGLGHDLFKENGLLKSLFSTIFDSPSGLILIPIIVGALWLFNRWTTAPNKDQRSKAGDVPLYIMMAIGAFYLFKLLTTGSL